MSCWTHYEVIIRLLFGGKSAEKQPELLEKNKSEKQEKNTCIFWEDVLSYRSRQGDDGIRVWRSLVSRLNGVQEASSSNLDTRTKKLKQHLLFQLFSFVFGFERLDTTPQWGVVRCGLDRIDTIMLRISTPVFRLWYACNINHCILLITVIQ